MKKKSIGTFMIICVATFLFNACVKENDFSLKGVEGVDPVFAAPLLNAEMSIKNVLNLTGGGESPIQVEFNGDEVKIVFRDTLYLPLDIKRGQLKAKSGEIVIPVENEVDIDIFSKKVSGGCVFDTTLFELWIKGQFEEISQGESIPIDIQNLNLQLVDRNGQTTPINASVSDPITIGNYYRKLLSSNPNNIFSQFEPQMIRYSFDLVLDTSSIRILPKEIDIAMYFGISLNLEANIQLNDTLSFNMNLSDEDIDGSGVNGISADILYRFENTFPIDLNLQLYFLDASMNVIDSLFYDGGEKIISNNTLPSQLSFIPVGKDRLKRLNRSPHVILRAGLTTNARRVQILPRHRLKVLLGAKVYSSGYNF